METLHRASRFCNNWVEKSLALLGISMAIIVVLQVFCRYLLNHSLFWSEELARYLLIWLSFLGATAAYYRKVHPGIDILTSKLKKNQSRIISLAVHGISILFFLIMIIYGTLFAHFIRVQISPALGVPKWLIVSIIPISGILFLLHALSFVAQEWKVKNLLDD